MAVLMRGECGRRYAALAPRDQAFVCAFECMLCRDCGGELVRRLRRGSRFRQAAA